MPFQTVFILHLFSGPVCGTHCLLVQLDEVPLSSVDGPQVLTDSRASPGVYTRAACHQSYSVLPVSFT